MTLSLTRLGHLAGLSAIATIMLPQASQAATFAGAFTNVEFFNFSTETVLLGTDTQAFTEALAVNGTAASFSDAQSLFQASPIQIQNFTEGTSQGTGSSYLATTDGFASAIGSFLVEDIFSFDFNAQLDLATSADRAAERALSSGNISLSLFASETLEGPRTLIDAFELSGFLSSVSDADQFTLQKTANIELAPFNCPPSATTTCGFESLGGLEESMLIDLNASYSREFEQPTYLTLVETKSGSTLVAVPEPRNLAGLLLLAGCITINIMKRSSQVDKRIGIANG